MMFDLWSSLESVRRKEVPCYGVGIRPTLDWRNEGALDHQACPIERELDHVTGLIPTYAQWGLRWKQRAGSHIAKFVN